jgi:hypothetical protein
VHTARVSVSASAAVQKQAWPDHDQSELALSGHGSTQSAEPGKLSFSVRKSHSSNTDTNRGGRPVPARPSGTLVREKRPASPVTTMPHSSSELACNLPVGLTPSTSLPLAIPGSRRSCYPACLPVHCRQCTHLLAYLDRSFSRSSRPIAHSGERRYQPTPRLPRPHVCSHSSQPLVSITVQRPSAARPEQPCRASTLRLSFPGTGTTRIWSS